MLYWLGLGANIGDTWATMETALGWLAGAIRLVAVSPAYETAPRDLVDQPPFLNAAVRVETPREPPELLTEAKRLERELGRDPGGVRYGPRAIDCDILLWEGGEWHDATLDVPHPRLAERRFALLPLLDLDPDLALPDGRSLRAAEARLDPLDQPARRLDRRLVPRRADGDREL